MFLMKENRSLIFMRDLLLLLTLDHQNVATKMAQLRITLLLAAAADDHQSVTNLKSVNDNQTVSCQEQMNQCFYYRLVLYEQHIAALFYTTILQDSITLSLLSSITHSSKQLKQTNLPDYAFWKANTFSCSKGLIFVL